MEGACIIQKNTLTRMVTDQLRQDILLGEIASGSRITVQSIAKRYNTSALPVREARPFTVFQKSGAQAAFNTEEIAIETRAGKGQPYVLAVMGDSVEDVLMG